MVSTKKAARRSVFSGGGWTPVLAVAAAVSVVAGNAEKLLAHDFSFSPVFETNKQSLYQTGSAAVSIDKTNQFLGATWDVSGTVSKGNPNGGNGFSLTAYTSGRVGLEWGVKIDSGSVDATLPFDVKISTPNANTLVSGQYYTIDTSASFKQDQGSFTTRSATFQFYSDFVCQVNAALAGKASMNILGFSKQVSFDRTDLLNLDARMELIGVNRDNDSQVRILPALFGAAQTASDAYDAGQGLKELRQDVNAATGRREKIKVALRKFGYSVDFGSPVEASVRLPYIELQGAAAANSPTKLAQSGKDAFMDVTFDLDRIAMFPPVSAPPMTINAEVDLIIGSIDASATMIDLDFVNTFNMTQNAEIEARSVGMTMDLGRTVVTRVRNADGTIAQGEASRRFVDMTAGQKLEVVYDGSDLNILPTYTPNAYLKSQFGLSIDSQLQFNAFMASISASLLGFEVGGFSFGPLFSQSIDLPSVNLGNVFDSTFQLSGFNSVVGSSVFVSNKPALFTGAAGTDKWSDASNWSIAGVTGLRPNIGDTVMIDANTNVFATAQQDGAPRNAAYNISIGRNSRLFIEQLDVAGNIYNDGQVNLVGGGNLTLLDESVAKGDHVIYGGRVDMSPNSQITVANSAAINSPVRLTLWGTTMTMDKSRLVSDGGPATLTLANGANITVGNITNDPANLSVIGSATEGGSTFDIVKQGVFSSKIQTVNGANLTLQYGLMMTIFPNQQPTPAELVAGTGPTSDMLNVVAGNGSTITLKGGTGEAGTGQAEWVRFTTVGNGVIKAGTPLSFGPNILEGTGKFVLDGNEFSGDSVATVNFYSYGSTTGEATPFINNSTMQFISRPSRMAALQVAGQFAKFAGTGEMQLMGYGQPVVVQKFSVNPLSYLTNGVNHTIRADNANIGNGQLVLVNQGNIIADGNLGAGVQSVTIQPGSPTSGNGFYNEGSGVVSAVNSTLRFTGNARIENGGLFEARQNATLSLANTNLANMSSDTTSATLSGGAWRVYANGRIELPAANNGSSVFVNKADIEVSQNNFAGNTGGVYVVQNGTGTARRIDAYSEFRNDSGGIFTISSAGIFNSPKFTNSGFLDLQNGTAYNVTNRTGGLVAGAGEVRLASTSANFATNTGTILATEASGVTQLIVSGGPGVTVIENLGLMGAIDSDLFIGSGLQVASTGVGRVSGSWMVNGTNRSARIVLPVDPSVGYLNTVANGTITLVGPYATFQSQPGSGGAIKNLRDTLTTIGTDGTLALDANSQTFANRVAITTSGKLTLTNSATVSGPGIDLNGTVSGNGVVDAPINLAGGRVEATGGTLTLKKNISGTAASVVFAGKENTILNPVGARIDGVTLRVSHPGAAIWGTGTIAPTSFGNLGVVAVQGTGTLRFEGSGTFENDGIMTSREGGTLELAGINLDNSQGTLSVLDTAGYETQGSGGGIGGTLRLRGAFVNGGNVSALGYTKIVGTNAVTGTNSRIDGYGSLSNVKLTMGNASLVADGSLGGTRVLTVTPALNSDVTVFKSNIQATNQGTLRLNAGTYSSNGSTYLADNGFIEFINATVKDGKLATANGGVIRAYGSTTFYGVRNTGRVDVPASNTLNITGTTDSRDGTINVYGNLNINNSELIGGNVVVQSTGTLTALGNAQLRGVNFSNTATGKVSILAGSTLTVDRSPDGVGSASAFLNSGTVTCDGQLRVLNSQFRTDGSVTITTPGSLIANQLIQDGGVVRVNGTANVTNYTLNAGILYGAGRITGSLINIGGSVQPGNSPGTLTVDGNIESSADSEYVMQVEYADTFDRIISLDGDIHLDGRLILDFSKTLPEALGQMLNQQMSFDLFDVAPGHSVFNDGLIIDIDTGGQIIPSNLSFDPATGSLSVFVGAIPEPTAIGALLLPALTLGRRRR